MNYYVKDSILGLVGVVGFILFVFSILALVISIVEGGVFTVFQVWQLILLVIGSVLVMHITGRIRVKLWTERIKSDGDIISEAKSK